MDIATQNSFLNLLLLSLGIWILIKGSNGVIEGASTIARNFGIPDLVIGITLVSIGTSLPELATNVYAVIINEGGVAIGNVVGSNITNVLLVAGIAVAGLGLIPIDRAMYRRDGLTMIMVYLLFSIFCFYGSGPSGNQVTQIEGVILLVCCVGYILILLKKNERCNFKKTDDGNPVNMSPKALLGATFKTLISCLLVILGAKCIVDNIIWTGRKLEIPEELLSATVIALGTSLPEVAVTVSGILKKKRDIALGNIIGSNIFNILLVMGVTTSIRPVGVSSDVMSFLIPYMVITGFAFVAFMRTSWALVRWEGIAFLLGYVIFVGWNLIRMRP